MVESSIATVAIGGEVRMTTEKRRGAKTEMLEVGIGITGGGDATTPHSGTILDRDGISRRIARRSLQTLLGEESDEACVKMMSEISGSVTMNAGKMAVKTIVIEIMAPGSIPRTREDMATTREDVQKTLVGRKTAVLAITSQITVRVE